jgi:hypothetical protein
MVELKVKIDAYQRRILLDAKEKKENGEEVDDGTLALIGDIILGAL